MSLSEFDFSAREHTVLQHGRNLTVRVAYRGKDAVLKCFPAPGPVKAFFAKRLGIAPKPQRAFDAARFLHERFPGATPEPLEFSVSPDGTGRFASVYEPGLTSFTAVLAECYRNHGPGPALIALLERIAAACRRLHDCGFYHGDLGNQNIALAPDGRILFLDLNRCRRFPRNPDGVPAALRARDLSRIALPSDFLRVFFEMYWGKPPEKEFLKAEYRARARFRLHSATRRYRHPLRPRRPSPEPEYPHPKDLWIWDPCSEQALVTLRSRDRRKYQSATRVTQPLCFLARNARSILRRMRRLKGAEFERPVLHLANRAFISLSADPNRFSNELDFLAQLDCPGVHLRFYAHEDAETTDFKIQAVHRLTENHRAVAISLVQDREAVSNPEKWNAFCTHVLDALHTEVIWVEYLHAVNRVKWGFWDYRELRRLLEKLPGLRHRYPDVSFLAPSVIDFEWDYFAGALRLCDRIFTKQGARPLSGASTELYVDRRGAPENMQGHYNAVGKLRLLRALTATSKSIDPHLIVTEFNWPLAGTGVWSPVGAPYVSPGIRFNDPSVSEQDAARFTLRYLLLGLCSGMAESMVVWSLAAHGFGLVDPGTHSDDTWRARPAFRALAFFFRKLRHANYLDAPRKGTPDGLWMLRFLSSEGSRVAIAWRVSPPEKTDAAPHPLTLQTLLPELPFSVTSITNLFGEPLEKSAPLSGDPVYFFESSLATHE